MQEIVLNDLITEFLEELGFTKDTATPQIMSDATTFANTYTWYITELRVLPENAKIASMIFMQKYALHDSNNICLEKTPEDMWDRLAIELAAVEISNTPGHSDDKDFAYWKKYFRDGLKDFAYSPQGSGLYSLGNPFVKASSSNCFVLPSPEDSLDGIFETAKNTAKIYAARGGVGFDISSLRPKNAKTNNAAKSSTGAVSFLDFYSHVTGMIGQEGRRGAEMISMMVNHPDIFEFITEKLDLSKQAFFTELNNNGVDINDDKWSAVADRLKSTSHANVSVMITDEFMNAVEKDLDFELGFIFKGGNYENISKVVKARDIWNALMEAAWETGEPGILNWDHIKRECPADQYSESVEYTWLDPLDMAQSHSLVKPKKSIYSFETVGVNPCAEETLSAFDSCNLGIFNLPIFVKNAFTPTASFDWDKYEQIIKLGIRAQDNIKEWDLPRLPLEENRLAGVLGRRISVGNTGLSDCLAALGFKYDTKEAIEMSAQIYEFLAVTAYTASINLASEKGAFPAFDFEKHMKSPFIQRLFKKLSPETRDAFKATGLRNIGLLTQAPAGSMSILFRNCSSGIEPMFEAKTTRNVKKPGTKDFEQYTYNHQALEDCVQAGGNPAPFVSANTINYSMRIKMQAAIQKNIDHSISSTINLPNDVTVGEVNNIYLEAFHAGLKGITVYRDGCRTGVLSAASNVKTKQTVIVERPKVTDIDIHKTKYKDKTYMILIGKVNGMPIEVFGGLEDGLSLPTTYTSASLTKKSRGHYSLTVQLSEDDEDVLKVNDISARFPAGDIITLTRMISLSLRNGVSVSEIVDQLSKSGSNLYDAPTAFARVLKLYVSDEEVIAKEKQKGKLCPHCNSSLEFKRESGCITELCTSCSYVNSKCG